jgi:four helix bundle protein
MRNETEQRDLKERTRAYALRVVRLVGSLPRTMIAEVMGRQLLRAGTAVGANYRAACRARSRAEFVAKMGLVEEEADESLYWMELIVDAGLVDKRRVAELMAEGDEILSIIIASIRTARSTGRQPTSG